MMYKFNEKVSVKALADLRESVGWNRMVCPDYQGKGIGTDLMDKMIEYLKEKRIYMISVVYEECLKPFYERFGFYNMLCGQMEIY